MRVTQKGQVTIPKAIRDKLGIVPGSEVTFVDNRTRVLFEKVGDDDPMPVGRHEREAWYDRHFERMRGTIDTKGMDGKDFVDWLRGPRDDVDPS